MLRFRNAFKKLKLTTSPSRCSIARLNVCPQSRIHVAQKRRALSSCRSQVVKRDTPLTLSDAQRSTIYALSTPPGKAGVAVVRVSGPDVLDVWKSIVRPASKKGALNSEPVPWKLHRCQIINPKTEEVVDDGLVVYFKGPKSFTTEDVLELHLHSGRAIIAATLSALSSLSTCRPAAPGEFTRRAFLGGRLDLTQVEGLKDLIDAETEGQRRVALGAAGGATREKFDELRRDIISALAKVEALIDFGEGEEIEEGVYEAARSKVAHILTTIHAYLSDSRRGELLRSGIRLAIFGPPNAGKSSLLNFLAQREAAIVTPIPGTTRDILELSLDIGGLPIIVADTAGLRKTVDVVEQIGVERARNAVKAADISICVLSLPEILSPAPYPTDSNSASTVEQEGRFWTPGWQEFIKSDTYFLLNKSDLASPSSPASERNVNAEILRGQLLSTSTDHGNTSKTPGRAWIASLTTGRGMEDFLTGFSDELKERYGVGEGLDSSSQAPVITRARHREHLESTCRFLEAFMDYGSDDIVLAAEELRYAVNAVGRVTGAIGVEDVLDALFQDFCIGK